MSGGGERVWSRAGHFVPLPEDADLTPDPVLVRIRLFGSCFGGFYPILALFTWVEKGNVYSRPPCLIVLSLMLMFVGPFA